MSLTDENSDLNPSLKEGRGDDAGIQSPTTTGSDLTEERPTAPGEGPVTDVERQEASRKAP